MRNLGLWIGLLVALAAVIGCPGTSPSPGPAPTTGPGVKGPTTASGPAVTAAPTAGPTPRPTPSSTPQPTRRPTPAASRPSAPAVDLMGTKFGADSVVFLLDCSASMPLAQARTALLKAADSMDWPQKFNAIGFFADGTDPAMEELSRASSNNKEALRTGLGRLSGKGTSAIIPAVKEAFAALRGQSPESVKAVVIFTDGKSTDFRDLAEVVNNLDSQRDVLVYAVLAGSAADAVKTLTKIAGDNGGKFLSLP
ncbi:MAG: VWA domain-containing protein [Phycisphaerae bacterium]